MPAFNEGEIIEATVRAWYDQVVAKVADAELVVVDDCSTDGMPAVLARLAAEMPRLKPVRPERNGGHGRALLFGFRHCRGVHVFQTDSDQQHDPTDFWKLWQRRDEADFVFGYRTRRADGMFRLAVTTGLKLVNLALWGLWVRDANCPFKLMRRETLAKVLKAVPTDAFVPMVMISLLARKAGFRVIDVPVAHFARPGGTQSLKGLLKWARIGARCTGQLLAVRAGWRERMG
jgi:glycosyltransferase involved in cell wall biosynthesis